MELMPTDDDVMAVNTQEWDVELVQQAPRLERVRLVAASIAEAQQAAMELAGVVLGVERHEVVERRPFVPDIGI